MGTRPFVSFDECKQKVPIPDVLQKMGISERFANRNGTLVGICPFPNHLHGPSPNAEQFKINIVDDVWLWRCWGDCKTAGNVVQFVMRMLGLSAEHARFWFAEHFGDRLNLGRGGGTSPTARDSSEKKEAGEVLVKPAPAQVPKAETKVVVTDSDYKPIRFRLQVDPAAPYLRSRGVSEETARRYGIGLASKGMMAGYIAVPVWHYPKGEFPAGYVGRWAGEDYNADQGRPRYKLPGNFPKQQFVFGINEALEDTSNKPLIVVEGFIGALHCVQHGFRSTIALLGSALSDEHVTLLSSFKRPIVLMFDGDESGREGMEAAASRLLPHAFVRSIRLDDGQQPDNLTSDNLNHALSFAL